MGAVIRAQVSNVMAQTFGQLAQMFNQYIAQLESQRPKESAAGETFLPGGQPQPALQTNVSPGIVPPQQNVQPTAPQFGPQQGVNNFAPQLEIPPGSLTQLKGTSGIGAPRTGLSLGNF